MSGYEAPDSHALTQIYLAAEYLGIEDPTLEQVSEIRIHAGLTGKKNTSYLGKRGGERIRRWLSDPSTYSPFLDEVALERALAFDWTVIARLSLREREEFFNRLASMDDPYDEIVSSQPIARTAGSGTEGFDLETRRRKAWLSADRATRQTVVRGVYRARGRGRAAAA